VATFTKSISNIPAGKTRIDVGVSFPSPDATAVGTYLIQASFDSGVTWRDVCGGSIVGNYTATQRPADPTKPILFSVSHNGLACSLQGILTVNKVIQVNFSVL
jgi:hypothetical protein